MFAVIEKILYRFVAEIEIVILLCNKFSAIDMLLYSFG